MATITATKTEEPVKASSKPSDSFEAVYATTREMLAAQPKEKVRVHNPPKGQPQHNEDVTVCVNGYIFLIKRGEYVEVPETVARILEEAQII